MLAAAAAVADAAAAVVVVVVVVVVVCLRVLFIWLCYVFVNQPSSAPTTPWPAGCMAPQGLRGLRGQRACAGQGRAAAALEQDCKGGTDFVDNEGGDR